MARYTVFIVIILCLSISLQQNADQEFQYLQEVQSTGQKKITDLNILLPIIFEKLDQRVIQHTIYAVNGCYEWQSSHSNYLSIQGLKDRNSPNCESSAIIKLNTNQLYSGIIWIQAIDKDTKDVLKVESKINPVHRIEILSKFRTIDVGDIQQFEIIGYDSEGNSFSSLQGMRFEWTIEQEDNYLEYISIKDSQIKTTDIRKELEKFDFKTDIIVAKGLKTGHAVVKCSIKEEGYTQIFSNITIHVIEQFMLYPDEMVYILEGQTVQYELFLKKKENGAKQYQQIQLPSINYEWKSDDTNIGQINTNGQLKGIKKDQISFFIVKEKKSINNVLRGNFKVVEPRKIDFQITQYSDEFWLSNKLKFQYNEEHFDNSIQLVKNRFYYIRAYLYDQNMQQIFINENIPIQYEFDANYFEILKQVNHEIVLKAKKLKSNLMVKVLLKKENLYSEKKLSIVNKVMIIKPKYDYVHLPYIEEFSDRQQTFQLKALGGSQKYEWISEDNQVAVISSMGIILSKNIGIINVIVRDIHNPLNNDTILVKINPIDSLNSLEKYKEIMINSQDFILGIAQYQGHKFSNCSSIQMILKTSKKINNTFFQSQPDRDLNQDDLVKLINHESNQNKFIEQLLSKHRLEMNINQFSDYIDNKEITLIQLQEYFNLINNYGICGKINFQTFQVKTEIQAMVSLNFGNSIINYQTEQLMTLKIYKPYETIKPILLDNGNHLLLSDTDSYNWKFNQGPSAWEIGRNLNIDYQIVGQQNDILKVQQIQSDIIQKYNIQCVQNKYGTFQLQIQAQNQADINLPKPVRVSNSIHVTCQLPHSLIIYLNHGLEFMEIKNMKLTQYDQELLRNDNSYDFYVKAFNKDGHPFHNFSSIQLKWEIQGTDKATLKEYSYLLPEAKIYKRKCKGCMDQIISLDVLHKYVGQFKLKVYQFENEIFHDLILLKVLNNLRVESNEITLWRNQDFRMLIDLLEGSNERYQINKNDCHMIQHEYIQSKQQLAIMPLEYGQCTMEVLDLGLNGYEIVHIQIFVKEIVKIQIEVMNNLILVKNETIVNAVVLDNKGKHFHPSQLYQMNIQLQDSDSELSKENSLEIIDLEEKNTKKFKVKANKKGNYKLVAILNDPNSNKIIKSNRIDFEAYEHLSSIPSQIIISAGCEATIQILGGPVDQTKFYFMFKNDENENFEVKTVEEHKLYKIIGKQFSKKIQKLQFRVIQKQTEQVLSTLDVQISIREIQNLKILGGQNDRIIHNGTHIRLISQIFDVDMNPFTLGVCDFDYKWRSKTFNVIQLHHDFGEGFDIGVNASSIGEGPAEIELQVLDKRQNKVIKINSHLFVKKPLSHRIPTYILQQDDVTSQLLIPPDSGYTLQPSSNKNIYYEIDERCQQNNIKVNSQTGHVTTGGNKFDTTTIKIMDQFKQNEILTLPVFTTMIASIFVQDSYLVQNLQVEGDSVLRIILQDTFGRSFPNDLDNVNLLIHTSNPNVIEGHISIDKRYLTLKAKSEGTSLVKLFLEDNPGIYDVFYVSVGSIIKPISPVKIHVGGKIQFEVDNNKIGNLQQKWRTENPQVLSIDGISGKALALSPGIAQISYDDTIRYKVRVEVLKITKIVPLFDQNTLKLSNIQSDINYSHQYLLEFELFAIDQANNQIRLKQLQSSNNINNNLVSICQAQKRDWFTVSSQIVKSVDDFERVQCQIRLVPFNQYPESLMPKQLELYVLVQNQQKLDGVSFNLEQKFNLDINWKFKVVKDIKSIELSNFKRKFDFNVITANEIEIKTDMPSSYVTKNVDRQTNIITITIQIPQEENKIIDSNLIILDMINLQKQIIRVYFDPEKQNRDNDESQFGYQWEFIIFIICTILFIVLSFIKIKNQQIVQILETIIYSLIGGLGFYYIFGQFIN